jgi:hypothetical protein
MRGTISRQRNGANGSGQDLVLELLTGKRLCFHECKDSYSIGKTSSLLFSGQKHSNRLASPRGKLHPPLPHLNVPLIMAPNWMDPLEIVKAGRMLLAVGVIES